MSIKLSEKATLARQSASAFLVKTSAGLLRWVDSLYIPEIQWGRVTVPTGSVSTAGTTASVEVTFPREFTSTPGMSVTVRSNNPSVCTCSCSGTSTTGTTIYATRSNLNDTEVYWMAVVSE